MVPAVDRAPVDSVDSSWQATTTARSTVSDVPTAQPNSRHFACGGGAMSSIGVVVGLVAGVVMSALTQHEPSMDRDETVVVGEAHTWKLFGVGGCLEFVKAAL
jgi:hypothetical protein